MTDHLAEQLKPFLPIRVVLELQEGVIHGLTELSFSMKMDPQRVNIFWSGKAYSILGEHDLDGVSWAEENCKPSLGQVVVDPLHPDSPIEIDWSAWLEAFRSPTRSKFHRRNAPFTAKPLGVYVIRALVAERSNPPAPA